MIKRDGNEISSIGEWRSMAKTHQYFNDISKYFHYSHQYFSKISYIFQLRIEIRYHLGESGSLAKIHQYFNKTYKNNYHLSIFQLNITNISMKYHKRDGMKYDLGERDLWRKHINISTQSALLSSACNKISFSNCHDDQKHKI